MPIQNEQLVDYSFLDEMFKDDYFPNAQVEKGKAILVRLCEEIERQKPVNPTALYVLTHAATEEFNVLAVEFEEHNSEIETGARDCIATDFAEIAEAYGFKADIEELTATREW